MLSVTDLHTYYGDSHVLQGVDLRVPRGHVIAVLGRNGVGKTTLCRSIVGFTPARRGCVEFEGDDITAKPPHDIFRRRLAIVPQGRRIFTSLTVHENLSIARHPADERWTLARVYSLFPRLAERSSNRGNELSGGEQQMLAVARALVGNPLLLVMDEPTEGLSPALVAQIGNVIRQVRDEGTSVLLVEQNAAFAVRLADFVYVMSQGRIVHESAPAALWHREDVKTRYLGVPSQGH
jgi:branched-chain amino acid transport system ATP-binding protein